MDFIKPPETKYFIRTPIKQTISIHRIITMYYFEFGKDYVFNGEWHDFWEFLYVDKGEVQVTVDDATHLLKQGTIIFHKPNEYHSFFAAKGKAPNLIVMSFDCRSRAMKHFADQVIHLEDEERNLLAQIIKEGAQAFTFPFAYPLERREQAPIGSEQLVKCYLETFLIRLLRKKNSFQSTIGLSSAAKEKNSDELTRKIIVYMEGKLGGTLSLDEISHDLFISKTKIKDEFKKNTDHTVMEYFAKMKIDRAKVIIREENSNFTEISQQLGFNSVHYFSKSFKKMTGMTPSEYARSVKARIKDVQE